MFHWEKSHPVKTYLECILRRLYVYVRLLCLKLNIVMLCYDIDRDMYICFTKYCLILCKSCTIVVDFRHRFTVINMNGTLIPIGQIYSFHS